MKQSTTVPRNPASLVACPTCHAQPGSPCMRPSGHRVFAGGFHKPREKRGQVSRADAEAQARVRVSATLKRHAPAPAPSDWPEKLKRWASAPPRGPFPSRMATKKEAKEIEAAARASYGAAKFYPQETK